MSEPRSNAEVQPSLDGLKRATAWQAQWTQRKMYFLAAFAAFAFQSGVP